MKYGIPNTPHVFIMVACIMLCSPVAGLYHPRQIGRLADTIQKTNGNLRIKQQALARAFKQSITQPETKFKPIVLQKVVTAASRNSRFKQLELQKNCIDQAIDEFHTVPGFLTLFSRLIHSIVWHNTANFNGAMAEVKAAIEKSKQQKIILAFGKPIKNEHGQTLTEIDLITQDEQGNVAWEEIKTRTKLRKNDHIIINAQKNKQRDLALRAHVKHTLSIQIS